MARVNCRSSFKRYTKTPDIQTDGRGLLWALEIPTKALSLTLRTGHYG